MSTVVHDTFTIARVIAHPPERVYRAFADPERKARWFAGPNGWKQLIREHDFQVGGKERVRGQFPSGEVSDFRCTYLDIVPNERIVYLYDMEAGGRRLSVSLATIEVLPAPSGTRLLITEQGTYFGDRTDADNRRRGTEFLMDAVAASLDA